MAKLTANSESSVIIFAIDLSIFTYSTKKPSIAVLIVRMNIQSKIYLTADSKISLLLLNTYFLLSEKFTTELINLADILEILTLFSVPSQLVVDRKIRYKLKSKQKHIKEDAENFKISL